MIDDRAFQRQRVTGIHHHQRTRHQRDGARTAVQDGIGHHFEMVARCVEERAATQRNPVQSGCAEKGADHAVRVGKCALQIQRAACDGRQESVVGHRTFQRERRAAARRHRTRGCNRDLAGSAVQCGVAHRHDRAAVRGGEHPATDRQCSRCTIEFRRASVSGDRASLHSPRSTEGPACRRFRQSGPPRSGRH